MIATSPMVSVLAPLAARHKLVPFLGAGCSVPILHVDWDGIRDEMAYALGVEPGDHLVIAQQYVDSYGKSGLCDFLKPKLLVDGFDAERGTTQLQIMSLGLGIIYTTNQDNILEKCFEQFGRNYKPVIELEDLAESVPADRLLFKYHGDLSNPDSVVFTSEDYQKRIDDPDHFLNIRLRSDLLAKNLLFIGYSLRDKNIQLLLSGLHNAFRGKLPSAYLIAFEYSNELESLCNSYGVTVIDPMKEFPGSKTHQEAFESFLSALAEETIKQKHDDEISDILTPRIPPSRKVLTIHEVNAIERIVDDEPFPQALHKFRATMDTAVIPSQFEARVVNALLTLAQKCSSDEESDQFIPVTLHLYLNEPQNRLIAQASVMAVANVRQARKGLHLDTFLPQTRDFPREANIIAGAYAIELLQSWGRTITDVFRSHLTHWIDSSASIDSLPPSLQSWITERIDAAWNVPTTYENPIQRQRKLAQMGLQFVKNSVRRDIFESIPKTFFKPYQE
ncbi:SIR2 family NAD-dependent protein deacylase [Alicyclobacillus tolerans]|uniref:SIR2-like domain-containing protein n=1 Tax=Alicyclobacillus tolerans TaxID=90970 RepID=A0A1M6TR54_9BACL|nr:SIR2 family protein [Alicyclobacillus montanus]SHK59416.1 SIR2-like domain-containing protein [Alicyclobacillus montanus]